MRVFGIDPSTHTGVVVADKTGILFAEEIEFKKLIGFPRASAIVGRVMEIKEQWKPDFAMIESIIVGHASSAIPVIQIATIIRYFLWQEDFPFHEIAPSHLKKYACGVGNAKKEQVMMMVLKKWGYESKTNNIADAVVLAKMGLAGIRSSATNIKPVKTVKGV